MITVIGTIYSTLTGEPLPGATVQEIGGTGKAVTDSKGTFSTSVNSEMSYMKISAPEYKDKTVQATIFLIRKSEDLEPINGTTLPGILIVNKPVNWFGVVAVTALLSLGVAMYSNSNKTAKTVKAKI